VFAREKDQSPLKPAWVSSMGILDVLFGYAAKWKKSVADQGRLH
jgi:hypothetical protein